jgi:L-ascorbate metabolism protein UlaG (beta-lactamase superfamily)
MSSNTSPLESKINFLGHSCVLIESANGKNILVDPFLSQNPSYPASFSSLPLSGIDFIVLTHGHSDHTADAIETALVNKASVCATHELATLISKFSDSRVPVLPMNKGGSITLPDTRIKLTLTHAFHSSSFDAPDGNTYYAGEACGAIITLENGKSIYHAGDTCFFSEMELIKAKYSPEIAFLPIGDCYTMGPEEAARSANILGVKTAIPIHWGTFPVLSGTPEEFKDQCQRMDIDAKVLKPGESFII